MDLKKMIPFLDEDDLKELLDKVMASPDGTYQGVSMASLLPFLEDEDIDKMMMVAYQKGQKITPFLPFVSGEGLSRLVRVIVDSGDTTKVSLHSLLPFLEDDSLKVLGDKVIASGGSFGDLTYASLLPFLEDEDIDKRFLTLIAAGDPSAKNLAPFVSDEGFHELVTRYCAGEFPSFDVDAYYLYMDDEDIRILFHKAQNN
jgi:hypothetical protein